MVRIPSRNKIRKYGPMVEIDILMEESRVPIPTCIKRLANEMIGGSGQEANNPIGPILQKIMSPSLCT